MKRIRASFLYFLCLTALFTSAYGSQYPQTLDLQGTWRFAMDREDVGVEQGWYERQLEDRIELPGALQSQGYGDPISTTTPWVLSLYDHYWYMRKEYKHYAEGSEVKVPFLCQPPRHYLGPAWYQRDFEIPADWAGRRVVLFLERTRWQSAVWIDDRRMGSQDSLVAPHIYELGRLAPGSHRLTIRVDNRMLMGYRPDAHAVSDSLGSTWNGIVGRIELQATTPVWIDQVRVFPDIKTKSVRLEVTIGNSTGKPGTGTIQTWGIRRDVSWTAEGAATELEVAFDKDAKLWDEFTPALRKITVVLTGDQADDSREVTFGFRRISTDGSDLLINGRKAHFRGTHSGGDFPLTGYPAADLDYWLRLFATCKQWGLNHVRFHSFCPPEAAFTAADQLGIYLQPEAGMWNAISPGSPMEKRLYEESDRMLRAYGNHPSFVLFSPSNEPAGRWKESLPKWVEHCRKLDPRRLYTTDTGWPLIDEPGHVEGADFLALHRVGPHRVRGEQAWFGGNYLSSMQGTDVPIIVHELGQWCAFPNFDVIKKFTGYMRPGNFEIFRDQMSRAGLLDQDKAFADASGRFQAACYKEEIEANLRTPGLAGFQLLDLNDYVGQGTALVGVLDAFYEPKGYITADQWRRFCNTTVPLAVLKKQIYTTADPFDIDVQIAHYGPAPLTGAEVFWQIEDAKGSSLRQGRWIADIPLGSALPLGKITADLSALPAPAAYKLVVGISGTPFENDWNFWLYPDEKAGEAPEGILITRSFADAVEGLDNGRKVLWMPQYNQLPWNSPPIGRLPIFWNCLMGPKWERFLGLLCDPGHPALRSFPTESCYDWQWADVFRPACRAINIGSLPADLEPIVWMIDDWNRDYKLAGLFECRAGKGRLLVCAADLETDLNKRPAARQLRKSLLDYISSDSFKPSIEVSSEQLRTLVFDNQVMEKLGAVAEADEEDGRNTAARAIDGNPNTYWLTARRGRGKEYPHELTIRFPRSIPVVGLVWMNRQDQREHEGDICRYEIETGHDGKAWRPLMTGQMESTFDPQRIDFPMVVHARYIRIRALSGFGGDTSAALAEVAVLTPETFGQLPPPQMGQPYQDVPTASEDIEGPGPK